MEQDFGERLKKYRREKNLTQQDLADQLQVSNKTVSRWESGGGYPDVPLLVPLAKALGVTVDDLLDGERPVRSMARSDWQNLLSFAFVVGGGVLFYLLGGFMPSPVCYLIFIGCLVYGVYLQKHYCYQSKWFRWACGVTDLCVNISFLLGVFTVGAMALGWLSALRLYSGSALVEAGLSGMKPEPAFGMLSVLLPFLLAVVLLTGLTMALVERYGFGRKPSGSGIRLKAPGVRGVVPPLCIGLIPLFYLLFVNESVVARFFQTQEILYLILLGASLLVCTLLAWKKGHRRGFIPMGVLLLAADLLPRLGREYAWIPNAVVPSASGFVEATPKLSHIYERFRIATPAMAVAAVVLTLLALIPAVLSIKPKAEAKETEKSTT